MEALWWKNYRRCCKEKYICWCYNGDEILSWGTLQPKSRRPIELVGGLGLSSQMPGEGGGGETAATLAPLEKIFSKCSANKNREKGSHQAKLRHLIVISAHLHWKPYTVSLLKVFCSVWWYYCWFVCCYKVPHKTLHGWLINTQAINFC